MRPKSHVFLDYPAPPPIFKPTYVRKEKHNQYLKTDLDQTQQLQLFWNLDENLRIKINSASQISVWNADKIFIRVTVAVGRHVLNVKDSSSVSPTNPRWPDGDIEFDIYLKDLPESTQISFSLIALKKRKNKPEIHTPIGWMNLRYSFCFLRLLFEQILDYSTGDVVLFKEKNLFIYGNFPRSLSVRRILPGPKVRISMKLRLELKSNFRSMSRLLSIRIRKQSTNTSQFFNNANNAPKAIIQN